MKTLSLTIMIALLTGCIYPGGDTKHVEYFKKFLEACELHRGVEKFYPYEYGAFGNNGPEIMCKDGSILVYRDFINRLPKE